VSWSNLIYLLIGVNMGGLITLGVNLHLQKRERKVEYAIKNKNKIYEQNGNTKLKSFSWIYHFKKPKKMVYVSYFH